MEPKFAKKNKRRDNSSSRAPFFSGRDTHKKNSSEIMKSSAIVWEKRLTKIEINKRLAQEKSN